MPKTNREPSETLKYSDVDLNQDDHVRIGSRLMVNTTNKCVIANGVVVKVRQVFLTNPLNLSGYDVETPEGKIVFMKFSRLRRINA